jgi:hypothetical protein
MSYRNDERPISWSKIILSIVFAVFSIVVAIFLISWAETNYRVWHQHMIGKAELARAEYNRKIRVYESEAALMAAENFAKADVARAHGTAEANNIIGASISEGYLRWYYINGLHESGSKTYIYVPTEGMMPIMEAGRIAKSEFKE